MQAEVSFSDRPADIVEEGFDLALRIGEPPPDTRLVSRVVAQYKTLLCAAPSYLAARGEPQAIEDLAEQDCLVFTSRNQRQSWRLREGEDGDWIEASVRSRLRLDSGEALRNAAMAGMGIAFLPKFLVADDLTAGRLRQVLPSVDAGQAKIVALYPTRRLLEPRVRRFIDLMVEKLGP